MIEGGWGYVIAAYSLTWIVVGGLAVSVWVRWRGIQDRKR